MIQLFTEPHLQATIFPTLCLCRITCAVSEVIFTKQTVGQILHPNAQGERERVSDYGFIEGFGP